MEKKNGNFTVYVPEIMDDLEFYGSASVAPSDTALPEGIRWNRRLRPGDKTPIRLMVSEKAYEPEPYPSRGPAKEKGAAPRHKDRDGRS